MPILSFIAFSDLTATSGNPLTTTSTTGASGSFSVNAGAGLSAISINDDDPIFDDAFIDPGAAQTLAAAVTLNGTTFPAGSVVELEFSNESTIAGSPATPTLLYVRIGGMNVGITSTDLDEVPPAGTTFTLGAAADGVSVPFASLPCFTSGTLIETADGDRLIEDLCVGDLVRTMDHGLQPVRWIGQRTIGMAELIAFSDLRPITFEAGTLGTARALSVSPQHRMYVTGWQAELLFGEDAVLVPAKALVSDKGVRIATASGPVTYIHLLFDTHEVIFAEGAPSESFHPGEMGVTGFSSAQRDELLAIFGDVAMAAETQHAPAYPIVKTGEATALRPA